MVPGSSALANTSVKWPSSRRSTGQHRGGEVAGGVARSVLPGDQVHGDLGVGVAGELDACGLEFVAQAAKFSMMPLWTTAILPAGVAVRVGVAVGGPAVGGPAGVAQAGVPVKRCGVGRRQRLFEVGQPARPGGAPSFRPVPSSNATPAES